MKALVLGASGQIGGALLGALAQAGATGVGTYRSRPLAGALPLDVRDREAVERCLDRVHPEVVFLAVIAPGGVDYYEDHPDVAYAVNVAGTRNVALAAARLGVKLVFYSTDYLFDGQAGPYAEDAPVDPLNIYGRTKWEGEEIIRSLVPDHLIIRTTAVFSWNPGLRNFAMQVWERLGAGQTMRVPDDQWCNPTLAGYVAEVSVRLVEMGARGVFNVVGRDWMTRAALGKALASALGLDPTLILPTPTAELGQRAPRPLKAGLRTDKLERLLGEAPPGLNEFLQRFLRDKEQSGGQAG
jgi:dTDP-4-dehydrorhamnose reductase